MTIQSILRLAAAAFLLAAGPSYAQPGATPSPSEPPLRFSPEQPKPRQVSAEKWSQMAAELLRIPELRNPRLALECANKAIAANPRLPYAWLNRGSAYVMLDQPESAVRDFTQAITLAPQLSQAHYNRALAQESLGLYQEAARDYGTVIALDPRDSDACLRRAAVLFDLKKDAEACKDLSRACELGSCQGMEEARTMGLCP